MSDTAQRQGWWQATDGGWYPPEAHPNYQATPTLPQAAPSVRPPTVPVQPYTPPTARIAKGPKRKRRWGRRLLYAIGALFLIVAIPGIIQGFQAGVGNKDEGAVQQISACVDSVGDGDGTFDLTTAGVERVDGGYVFTSAYTGPAEGRETSVTWTASVGDGDDWKAYSVSGGTYTASPPDASVFDYGAMFNEYLTDFDVRPNSVRLTVPDDLLDGVAGKAFEWEAVLSIDGIDIDTCSAAFQLAANGS